MVFIDALKLASIISLFFLTPATALIVQPALTALVTSSASSVTPVPRAYITAPPSVDLPSLTARAPPSSKFSLSLDLHLPTPTCTQTITPDKNGFVPPGTCGSLYNYYPSFAAAVVASVFFGAISLVHLGQTVYFKTVCC